MSGVFAFDHTHDRPARELADLLGGKGAGLAEMTTGLGISVPPGFTIALPVCRDYVAGGWPNGLDVELATHLDALGERMGRRFGDPADPLLVAVRSGAPVSMPGMLDTVLNLGLNEHTVAGLARSSGQPWFAWDSYRRFILMYATTVLGLKAENLGSHQSPAELDELRQSVDALKARVAELADGGVPDDPAAQLRGAIEAVFRSWNSPRARTYRERESIAADLGTAVNVQAMVFGNRGPDSGTGVVFTRDPATGENRLYGDYLPRAQGEDVVAGTARTMPIAELAGLNPAVYAELTDVLRKLEVHYRDICDVEFTVEEGRLWLLQTRAGKRGAVAAVRIAVDLVGDPDIRLTAAEALERVPAQVRAKARAEVLARCANVGGADRDLLTVGLGASPGRVSGRIVLSAGDALDAEDDVILVRRETSPEDVAGMAASVGILTTRGGLVSHAAVVARGWGIPAVVGADELTLNDDTVICANGLRAKAGDHITIDGATGCVWRGVVPATVGSEESLAAELPQLSLLESWVGQRHEVSA